MRHTELPPSPKLHALSRRMQLIIVFSVIFLVLAVFGLELTVSHFFGSSAHAESKAAVPLASGTFRLTAAQMASLKIVVVEVHNFRTETMTDGKIAVNADRMTPVFSPYSGRVSKIIANPGDIVKQGSPLMALEASEYVQVQNDLIVAAASVNSTQSQLNQAQLNEKRKHGLFDIKAGSLQDWQQSQSDLIAAQSAHRAAGIALGAARNRLHILGKSDAEIARLESNQDIDPHTVVVAPISGTVIDRQVGPGQYVQSGASNPLYTIVDLSTVWLVANVREEDAPQIHRGATAEVQVAALPQKRFKAKITFVAPSVDPTTHRVLVRAEIANPDGMLKPEMFASVTLVDGIGAPGIGVPEQAILYEGDTARVWIALKDGTLALRAIKTARNNNGVVEVLAGLKSGDKVVTSGGLFIDQAAKGE